MVKSEEVYWSVYTKTEMGLIASFGKMTYQRAWDAVEYYSVIYPKMLFWLDVWREGTSEREPDFLKEEELTES
jgi:hypothetical protein